MAVSSRERVAVLLGSGESGGSFSARTTAPVGDLHVEVAGVGVVPLPVRAPVARKLIAVAGPARFGVGEQTLVDAAVRDTWEIAPDQVTLGGPRWPQLLDRTLEHVRDALGFPPTTRLRAEPHAMLVYGKGQFFLPHQDSEKHDEMVATLVLALPSVHTGGHLHITHRGQSRVYPGSRDELSLVAFYADCRHEVQPVRSGHRVTITFNVLRTTGTPEPSAEPDAELVARLTEHFTVPATRRYGGAPLPPPTRLVYLLDHEYMQAGLAWEQLKGVDATRAARLRVAAEQAGCVAVLALSEVKETWDAAPGGADRWDHDDDAEDGYDHAYTDVTDRPGAVEAVELIEDETVLTWWTDPDGTDGEPISLFVDHHEVCAATPSARLTPYAAEYEGYMGNYGNTLDRWYRRAAIVVWPRERAFAARAEAGSPRVLDELRDRIATDLDGARAAAASLAPFWAGVGGRPELLDVALGVVVGLDDADLAAMLLGPFRLEMFTTGQAAGLAGAAARYGDGWTVALVDRWFDPGYHVVGHDEWVCEQLPGLATALGAAGGQQLARQVLAGTWRRMSGTIGHWTRTARADRRRPQLDEMGPPLLRLLEAAHDDLREEIRSSLSGLDDTVLECVVPALRRADLAGAPWLRPMAHDCTDRLASIVARPPRADGDWSIAWSGCGCDLCATLATFLRSSSETVHRWPLRQDGRSHVHERIDTAGLPVRHVTERRGRPHTLVLTKTADLFTREADARDRAAADLAWLWMIHI